MTEKNIRIFFVLIIMLKASMLRQAKNQKFHNRKILVNTENGYVRGRKFDLDENYQEINSSQTENTRHRLHAWLGIPFAEKPVGELRFKRPVPSKGWDNILETNNWPNSCYQLPDMMISGFHGIEMWNPNTNVSEDCLYLNIWAPAIRSSNTPVLVSSILFLFYIFYLKKYTKNLKYFLP